MDSQSDLLSISALISAQPHLPPPYQEVLVSLTYNPISPSLLSVLLVLKAQLSPEKQSSHSHSISTLLPPPLCKAPWVLESTWKEKGQLRIVHPTSLQVARQLHIPQACRQLDSLVTCCTAGHSEVLRGSPGASNWSRAGMEGEIGLQAWNTCLRVSLLVSA